MAGNEGELKKLKIEAYSTIKYDAGDKVDEFFVMFNPPTLSQIYEIEYNEDQAQGTSGSSQSFGKMKPQEYTFEFLIDGTGPRRLRLAPAVIPPISPLSVNLWMSLPKWPNF